jgi:hypothetical protein
MFILASGVPKDKLIMSIPTYGLSFLLEDENKYQIGDQISAQDLPGPITHTTGMLASYEVKNEIFSEKNFFFIYNLDLRSYSIR